MKLIKSYLLFENLQQAKKILANNNIPEDSPDFLKIKDLLKNNLGYAGWFTMMFYENNISLKELKDLFDIILDGDLITILI